jgi:hypothetical protein
MFREDVFERAKQLSLEEFFEVQLGVKARQHGRRVGFTSCPYCGPSRKDNEKVSVTDDRVWYCHACGKGGSIVDAAMLMWDLAEPLAAAQRLAGGESLPARREWVADRSAEDARRKAVHLAIKALWAGTREAWEPAVTHYLVGRGIREDVVATAWRAGLIGTLPARAGACAAWLREKVGDDLLRAAELWSESASRPWPSYRQLVSFPGGLDSCELRTIHPPRAGEQGFCKSLMIGTYRFPVFWDAGASRSCLIVEGVIDMLSARSLGYPGHIMMLAGVGNWHPDWFAAAAERYRIELFEFGLDNDVDNPKNPGQASTARALEACAQLGLPCRNVAPARGDINDWLRAQRGLP